MTLTQAERPAAPTAAVNDAAGAGWSQRTVASLREAESLLDWLEANGHADRELVIVGDATFVVRWR